MFRMHVRSLAYALLELCALACSDDFGGSSSFAGARGSAGTAAAQVGTNSTPVASSPLAVQRRPRIVGQSDAVWGWEQLQLRQWLVGSTVAYLLPKRDAGVQVVGSGAIPDASGVALTVASYSGAMQLEWSRSYLSSDGIEQLHVQPAPEGGAIIAGVYRGTVNLGGWVLHSDVNPMDVELAGALGLTAQAGLSSKDVFAMLQHEAGDVTLLGQIHGMGDQALQSMATSASGSAEQAADAGADSPPSQVVLGVNFGSRCRIGETTLSAVGQPSKDDILLGSIVSEQAIAQIPNVHVEAMLLSEVGVSVLTNTQVVTRESSDPSAEELWLTSYDIEGKLQQSLQLSDQWPSGSSLGGLMDADGNTYLGLIAHDAWTLLDTSVGAAEARLVKLDPAGEVDWSLSLGAGVSAISLASTEESVALAVGFTGKLVALDFEANAGDGESVALLQLSLDGELEGAFALPPANADLRVEGVQAHPDGGWMLKLVLGAEVTPLDNPIPLQSGNSYLHVMPL